MRQSIGAGINYNLPHTNELASLDVEQAHNAISGPATIVTDGRSVDETHDGLRLSFQRCVRY